MKSGGKGDADDAFAMQRLDTWLWASRFFKTRKIASEAVKSGRVAVNGQRAKPARLVRINDELRIRRSQQTYTVVISGLSNKRLGAPLAAALFDETSASIESREQNEQLLKHQRAGLRIDRKRPGRRDRQKMVQVKNQIPDWD